MIMIAATKELNKSILRPLLRELHHCPTVTAITNAAKDAIAGTKNLGLGLAGASVDSRREVPKNRPEMLGFAISE